MAQQKKRHAKKYISKDQKKHKVSQKHPFDSPVHQEFMKVVNKEPGYTRI